MNQNKMDRTSSTRLMSRNKLSRCSCCHVPSNNLIIKWLLIIWLLAGIGLYLVDVFMFHVTSTIKDLISLPSDIIFLVAICNNVSLIGSISFELRLLLIISILIDCALLVAVPALIVEVGPNLLTYASLMISIILSIYYGVLYMRNPLFFGDDPTSLPYNHLNIDGTSRQRLSYNCPRSIPMSSNSGLSIFSQIPRHSCQF